MYGLGTGGSAQLLGREGEDSEGAGGHGADSTGDDQSGACDHLATDLVVLGVGISKAWGSG